LTGGEGGSQLKNELNEIKKMLPGVYSTVLESKMEISDHILLISAEYGPPPAPSAEPASKGGRGRRPPMVPDSFSIIVVGK
jgi:hypothetical protein